MTNETVIAILSELKKCYLGGIVDALDFAIEAVKAREPRVMTTKSVGAAGHPDQTDEQMEATPWSTAESS